MIDRSDLMPLADQQALTQRVYRIIKERILSLEIKPGTQLVERELAARLGISKSPVRDALQRLAGEGLVTQSDYHGMTVRVIADDEADELSALREVLEEMAVRLATPHLSDADLAEAFRCLDLAEQAIRDEDYLRVQRANVDFHGVFHRKCGNRPLQEVFMNLQNRSQLAPFLSWRQLPSSMAQELAQHRAVLVAAMGRDAERAGELMREHVHTFRLSYQRAKEQEEHAKPR